MDVRPGPLSRRLRLVYLPALLAALGTRPAKDLDLGLFVAASYATRRWIHAWRRTGVTSQIGPTGSGLRTRRQRFRSTCR